MGTIEFWDILSAVNVHQAEDPYSKTFLIDKRRLEIKKLLEFTPLYKHIDGDYLLVYRTAFQRGLCPVLISVHIDHVFNGDDLFIDSGTDGTVVGTLDNSAGISIVIKTAIDGQLKIFKNLLLSFTGGEQRRGYLGARETVRLLKCQKLLPIAVIVVDVTNENYDKDISIENVLLGAESVGADYLDNDTFAQALIGILEAGGVKAGYVPHGKARVDETRAYWGRNRDRTCLTLCIPVMGDIHSKDGCRTTLSKLEKASKALILLLQFFSDYQQV